MFAEKLCLLDVISKISKLSFHIDKNAFTKHVPDTIQILHYERTFEVLQRKVVIVFTPFVKKYTVSNESMPCSNSVIELL